jgi:hypothetical protein
MNEDQRFPDFAEVWVNANRARALNLAHGFATAAAALAKGWKLLRQRTPLEGAGRHSRVRLPEASPGRSML